MTKDELLKMELHDIRPVCSDYDVLRVYGGWIYIGYDATDDHKTNQLCFVPQEQDVNVKSI